MKMKNAALQNFVVSSKKLSLYLKNCTNNRNFNERKVYVPIKYRNILTVKKLHVAHKAFDEKI